MSSPAVTNNPPFTSSFSANGVTVVGAMGEAPALGSAEDVP
jgi:hypothetical protein